MKAVELTNNFTRDLKKIKKRSKDLNKLDIIVEKLSKGQELEPRNRPHKLIGNYVGKWECHIESDWLLVYELTDELVILYRTGTHSDLFD